MTETLPYAESCGAPDSYGPDLNFSADLSALPHLGGEYGSGDAAATERLLSPIAAA